LAEAGGAVELRDMAFTLKRQRDKAHFPFQVLILQLLLNYLVPIKADHCHLQASKNPLLGRIAMS
jgi:hypothetical protein